MLEKIGPWINVKESVLISIVAEHKPNFFFYTVRYLFNTIGVIW